MIILGVTHPISWNPAAALLAGGKLVAMAEEERFNRFKFSPRTPPDQAIRYCLREAGIALSDVGRRAIAWESGAGLKKKKRIPWNHLAAKLPFDTSDENTVFVRHHLAHAISSFFPSGFAEANVISLDAYGGGESGLLGFGTGADFTPLASVSTKGSWGHMYGKTAERIGFRFHADEGKMMGLAAYGEPLDEAMDFVDWTREIPAIDGRRFRAFLDRAPLRKQGEPFEKIHRDLAASAQAVLERAVAAMARALWERTGIRALCLAGGVALNCSLNGKMAQLDFVDRIFINPAAHDAGGALGAALWVHRLITGERPPIELTNAYLGPSWTGEEIEKQLREAKIKSWRKSRDPALEAASLLVDGKIIGWFQGRMEFGPRALGNRSILADPGTAAARDRVNDLKGRERWRPLSPSVLEEEAGEFVEGSGRIDSPFMLKAVKANRAARERIPATVHADGTMRVQTVNSAENETFARLLRLFKEKKGYGALLNTSFNLQGQPIVCSPKDAIGTFFASSLDALVIGDYVLVKSKL